MPRGAEPQCGAHHAVKATPATKQAEEDTEQCTTERERERVNENKKFEKTKFTVRESVSKNQNQLG